MRVLFWNIRGFGHAGHRTQLKEYIRKEAIDIIGLQETIRTEFRHQDILAVDPLERFEWHHAPATGHSGGMLLGFCAATYEILDWDMGPFFIAATIQVRASLRVLAVVQVYGPADHSRSAEFLGELQDKVLAMSAAQTPVLVGGDFNLIRSGADENNNNVNWQGWPCLTTLLRLWHLGKWPELEPGICGQTSSSLRCVRCWTGVHVTGLGGGVPHVLSHCGNAHRV